LPGLTVVPYQTASEALEAVAAGEADAALVDHVSALVAMAQTGCQGQTQPRDSPMSGDEKEPLPTPTRAADGAGRGRPGGRRSDAGRSGFPLYVDLVVVGRPVVEEPYAVAVHRDSRYLLRAINDALAEMEADGTLEALMMKWLEGN
jgi:ABC-type amino acid transport substrate-binding protein